MVNSLYGVSIILILRALIAHHSQLWLLVYSETDLDRMLSPPANYGAGRQGSATNTHSCSRIRAVPSHLRSATHMWPHGLGQFYQKYTEAYGIPILGIITYMEMT